MAPTVARVPSSTLSSSSGSSARVSADPKLSALPSELSWHDEEPTPPPAAMAVPRRSSIGRRAGVLSDRELFETANGTAAGIEWRDILTRDRQKWKRISEKGDGFVIHSIKEQGAFAVRAVGVLPCSVPEVVRLLHSTNAEDFLTSMEGLYGDDFKDGALIQRVNLRRLGQDRRDGQRRLMDLSVKSTIFQGSSGWRPYREKWAYLDAAYHRDGGQSFEKITTTLSPKEVNVPSSHTDSNSVGSRSRRFHDVTTAFAVTPEEVDTEQDQNTSGRSRPWKETRVFFYGAFTPDSRHGFPVTMLAPPAEKAIKQRLIAMARCCDRLTALVRRRRLGVQVLVDRDIMSMVFTKQKCVCCNRSIKLLSVRQCRICGHGVCSECSHKHERETKLLGSKRSMLEDIRVCDWCLDRVDRSDFSHLNDMSLLGPTVQPNGPDSPEASTVLKELLKDELVNAESPARMKSVMNIIKYVLDPEDASPSSRKSPSPSLASSLRRREKKKNMSPPQKISFGEVDLMDALESASFPQTPYSEAELSTAQGRPYLVDSRNPDRQMPFPVPDNEDDRLRAIDQVRVRELINKSDELNIICELAAKEMDSFASMVTIVTEDEEQVVATNFNPYQNGKMPRAEGFCSHTIMDGRPNLIPHPEADVRFHECGPVKEMGIRYYCGFPIAIEDGTVIGALCCVNNTTQAMNETQYNTMKKLAETASKVIRVQGRLRSLSSVSGGSK